MKEQWDAVVETLRQEMDLKQAAREEGLQTCRKVIQTSSKSIRHIHRHQFAEARQLLDDARALVRTAQERLTPHPDLFYAGYLQDAEKEYVEGEAVFAIVQGQPIPQPAEIEVHITSYLNGMAEAASECRRYVLDTLRHGDVKQAEQFLYTMEDIYDALITFDYPDALTGGLRRTCDSLRAVLERTRSDFSLTTTQKELQLALERTYEQLAKQETPKG